MQINIGLKIKELRKRDGRTQEAIAAALSVTAQAISRWEANGGYPDKEMIPAIANYFHVTIDELFGYSEDRTKKIENILKKAKAALNAQGDMTEAIEMLRAAVEEFPSETNLQVQLGYALIQQGWAKHGARSYTEDNSDYAHADTDYNSQNTYWHEALQIFEKVLGTNISQDDREAIILVMVGTYQNMGYTEKAISLSDKQNSLTVSKELLLPKATEGELQDKYQGEAIIALLVELKSILTTSVQTKISVFTSNIGIKSLITFVNFCESVFSDGNCGIFHYHFCELYLYAAMYTAIYIKDFSLASKYFEKGFTHKKKYDMLQNGKEYHYTAPLVSKVTSKSDDFSSLNPDFWKIWQEILPSELLKEIKQNEKYSECFE